MSLSELSKIKVKFWDMQDMNTHHPSKKSTLIVDFNTSRAVCLTNCPTIKNCVLTWLFSVFDENPRFHFWLGSDALDTWLLILVFSVTTWILRKFSCICWSLCWHHTEEISMSVRDLRVGKTQKRSVHLCASIISYLRSVVKFSDTQFHDFVRLFRFIS